LLLLAVAVEIIGLPDQMLKQVEEELVDFVLEPLYL
jgi:hypothetical protein